MPEQSESSVVAMTPRIFCKGCGYVLIGLESRNCPDCGRGFNPTDRRTFARCPPRTTLWRWVRRLLSITLLLLLAAGAGLRWLWWGWHAEHPTIARLQMVNPEAVKNHADVLTQEFTVRPIGPERLRWVLGERLSYLTDRLYSAELWQLRARDTEQLDFRSCTQIQELSVLSCELSNSNLSHLAGLAGESKGTGAFIVRRYYNFAFLVETAPHSGQRPTNSPPGSGVARRS